MFVFKCVSAVALHSTDSPLTMCCHRRQVATVGNPRVAYFGQLRNGEKNETNLKLEAKVVLRAGKEEQVRNSVSILIKCLDQFSTVGQLKLNARSRL